MSYFEKKHLAKTKMFFLMIPCRNLKENLAKQMLIDSVSGTRFQRANSIA